MGTESHTFASQWLRLALNQCLDTEPLSALTSLPDWWDAPAIRCAIETALLDLVSQRAGLPLASWLNHSASSIVPVNTVIGAVDEGVESRVRQVASEGFEIVKLKLGVAPFPYELEKLVAIAAHLPSGVRLRLDSNRSWGETEAQQVIDALQSLPIESLEEPLKLADYRVLKQLQARANWPIAIDESLRNYNQDDLLADPPVRRLVLKPMVLGGLLPALKLAARARSRSIESVVTTTVDSAIGVMATLHLAAAVGSRLAHGLDTGPWLMEDVAEGPVSRAGKMAVGDTSGLGLRPFSQIIFT